MNSNNTTYSASSSSNPARLPLDYSDRKNWLFYVDEPEHETDLIFIYPTIVLTAKDESGIDEIDNIQRINANSVFYSSGAAFAPYTNVFAPFYHQVSFAKAMEIDTPDEYCDYLMDSLTMEDVYAALDYYFEQTGCERPFIICGHSQGSAIVRNILEHYMKDHPEYLENMVAAYAVGFPITEEWLQKNPHIRFAEHETDTGVVISWELEAPGGTEFNYLLPPHTLAINPLNWRRDETPASIAANKGSLVPNLAHITESKIVPGLSDATIDLKRGCLVCTTSTDYFYKLSPMFEKLFGRKSLHPHDYEYFFVNIRENGYKRLQNFFGYAPE